MTTLPLNIVHQLTESLSIPCSLLDDLRQLHARQWELEDQTRSGGTHEQVARCKRDIDASNSRRHRLIGAIDDTVQLHPGGGSLRWYSETVGELCDRLLIFDLKYQALVDPAPIHAVCQHLQTIAAQLIGDLQRGRAALPPRAGVKVYNGVAEEGSQP